MNQVHTYQLITKWTGNKGTGTSNYRSYDRSHTITIEGKEEIQGSSDPAFRGDKTKHNPEDLFLASLSSCHMLWYLHLCADSGIVILEYSDHAVELMEETDDGSGHFTRVTLNPAVIVTDTSMIQKANELHDLAHKKCFIANSCNFPILHTPTCTSKNA